MLVFAQSLYGKDYCSSKFTSCAYYDSDGVQQRLTWLTLKCHNVYVLGCLKRHN